MIDTSRFFASAMMQRFAPFMNMYSQFRPLIFLPFNIWFFFATLPFRFFFFFTSFLYTSKRPVMQMKAKVAEIKDEVNDVLPAKLKSKAPIELRPRKSQGFNEDRPFHGFYTVEKSQSLSEEKPARRSVGKKEEQAAPSPAPKVDESASFKTKISEMEEQHQQTLNEKANLEQQLKELTQKYENDESTLSHVEAERRRFKNLISVEQRKCFDFQQQIVSLKNQLKKEHEAASASASAASSAPVTSEKASKKQKQTKKAPVSSDAPAQTTEQPAAWHGASHTQDYTEMVAKAQKEELDSGKTFSEVLKESLKKPELASSGSEKGQSEFTVVGGYDSNHHIYAPMSAV